MPQRERQRVWKGELAKTSGGLTKSMLMKNKRGKIVSRAKSLAAKKKENNLGQWLRSAGDTFASKPKKMRPQIKNDAPTKPGANIGKKLEAKISVGNIVPKKRKRKKRVMFNAS